jgi:A-macroglobulin complement component/alpha-2-macroglobulin family protein/MG2 domain-containing protein
MKTCEDYRDMMLEKLYGLLDEQQQSELTAHLASCSECAAHAKQSESEREVLAAAARIEGRGMKFAPPAPKATFTWRRKLRLLAVAAAALMICGLGTWIYDGRRGAQLEQLYLRLIVQGPRVVTSGTPRSFKVKTMTPNGSPREALVDYRLLDAQGRTLYSQRAQCRGETDLSIPVGVEVPPGAQVEVSALTLTGMATGKMRVDAAPKRYVTRASTDKPMYKPGEVVFFRSLTLERYHLKSDREHQVLFSIKSPRGSVVFQQWMQTRKGVADHAWQIQPGMPGGEYTLEVSSRQNLFASEKRKFTVRSYRLPRLKKTLKFLATSYGPGAEVTATLTAERTEGGAASRAKLVITATLDGKEIYKYGAIASSGGVARISFRLPAKIERGEGLLSIAVDDGGTVETAAKSIPIALNKLKIDFYPEGGDLVAGLVNRCYFAAHTTMDKPAKLLGWVVDGSGRRVTRAATGHKGMGVFSFTPRAGERYELKIDEPEKIESQHFLPAARKTGVVLSCPGGVTGPEQKLPVLISTTEARQALVIAVHCRGTLIGQQNLFAGRGQNRVNIKIDPSAHGVMTVTAYQKGVSPVAERLVYRRSNRRLKVQVISPRDEYSPGEKARVALLVTDENGRPTSAVLGVAVVDEGLIKMADDDSPGMLTHFFLTTEVEKPEDLEEADFYLADGSRAAKALDLLLGVQGWRRFAWKNVDGFVKAHGEDAQHFLAMAGMNSSPSVFDNYNQIGSKYWTDKDQHSEFVSACWTGIRIGLAIFAVVALAMLLAGIKSKPVRRLSFSLAGAAGCVLLVAVFAFGRGGANAEIDCLVFAARAKQEGMPVAAAPPEKAGGKFGWLDPEKKVDERPMLENAPVDAAFRQIPGRPGRGQFALEIRDARKEPMARAKMKVVLGEPWRGAREEMERFRRVRQYAHVYKKSSDGARRDFTETLYWNPRLIAGSDGRAEISFDLCDSVTTFKVSADAHSGTGRLGSGDGKVVSRVPFYMEPKLPVELSFGDRLDLPLAVVNSTKSPMSVKLALAWPQRLFKLLGKPERELTLGAGKRSRVYFPLEVIGWKGGGKFLFSGTGGALADKVERSIPVVAFGFPKDFAKSGQLSKSQDIEFEMPDQVVAGTLSASLTVYPSPLATMQKGLEGMLREPHGCFEQTSSSNYPNTMILQYIEQCGKRVDPKITARAHALLKKGYKRLTSYECKKKGYEWFGGDPGHEALTAMGLMQFRDMSQVCAVDTTMMQRTRKWLLAKRDDKGGFKRNPRALDSFGRASAEITNAYILMAITENGKATGLEQQLDATAKAAAASSDAYLVALAANCMLNVKRDAKKLLQKLAAAQKTDGSVTGAKQSIVGSTGVNLGVETSALAALAWMKGKNFAGNATAAVNWINKQRGAGGNYYATQATVLALKAQVHYARKMSQPDEAGRVRLYAGRKLIAEKAFGRDHRGPIELPGIESHLLSGTNKLRVKLSTKKSMPYTFALKYTSPQPPSSSKCALRLETRLAKPKVKAGDSVGLQIKVRNVSGSPTAMATAIIGLPGGLIVRTAELKELVKQKQVAFYETRGREIILYWRGLAAGAEKRIKLNPVAEIPGRFSGPASRAYLYYSDDVKCWTAPTRIQIAR